MPTRPPVFRGPGQHVDERARKRAFDRTRPGARARGYDADWLPVRARVLQHSPLCCEPGCLEAATEVDHVQSVRDRPDLRLAEFNLRTFCKRHHSARTARDHGFARKGGRD
jgi:5-methylcytosine-specific restriction enzyme A